MMNEPFMQFITVSSIDEFGKLHRALGNQSGGYLGLLPHEAICTPHWMFVPGLYDTIQLNKRYDYAS